MVILSLAGLEPATTLMKLNNCNTTFFLANLLKPLAPPLNTLFKLGVCLKGYFVTKLNIVKLVK